MSEYSHVRIATDNPQTTAKKNADIKDYFSSTPERLPTTVPVSMNQPTNKGSYVDYNEQIIPTVLNKLLGIQKI